MADDWEEDLLNKLEEMLRNMGMPISREQLKGFMNQFKTQFDALGINPENRQGRGEFQLRHSDPVKTLQRRQLHGRRAEKPRHGHPRGRSPAEIDPSALEESDDPTLKSLPRTSTSTGGTCRYADFALKGDIETEQLEIELVKRFTD